VSDLAELMYFC